MKNDTTYLVDMVLELSDTVLILVDTCRTLQLEQVKFHLFQFDVRFQLHDL